MANPFPERPALERFDFTLRSPKAVVGSANRDPEGAMVSPSGLTKVNVTGTECFDGLADDLGIDREKYGVLLGGDKAAHQVSCVIVPLGVPGAVPVRRDEAKTRITLYLHELFKDMPSLRPTSRRWCTLDRIADGKTNDKKNDFIVLNLNTALPRHTTSRKAPASPAAEPPKPEAT